MTVSVFKTSHMKKQLGPLTTIFYLKPLQVMEFDFGYAVMIIM